MSRADTPPPVFHARPTATSVGHLGRVRARTSAALSAAAVETFSTYRGCATAGCTGCFLCLALPTFLVLLFVVIAPGVASFDSMRTTTCEVLNATTHLSVPDSRIVPGVDYSDNGELCTTTVLVRLPEIRNEVKHAQPYACLALEGCNWHKGDLNDDVAGAMRRRCNNFFLSHPNRTCVYSPQSGKVYPDAVLVMPGLFFVGCVSVTALSCWFVSFLAAETGWRTERRARLSPSFLAFGVFMLFLGSVLARVYVVLFSATCRIRYSVLALSLVFFACGVVGLIWSVHKRARAAARFAHALQLVVILVYVPSFLIYRYATSSFSGCSHAEIVFADRFLVAWGVVVGLTCCCNCVCLPASAHVEVKASLQGYDDDEGDTGLHDAEDNAYEEMVDPVAVFRAARQQH